MWIKDDAGDLVNLDLAEFVVVNPLEKGQDAPTGATHEVIVYFPDETSARVSAGSEAKCRVVLDTIAREFLRHSKLLLI